VKPARESVAVVVRNAGGEFLVVRRPGDPADPLAGAWGFPAATRQPGEDALAAAHRIGPLKLGVTLSVGRALGERSADRGGYLLRLTDYEAVIAAGIPAVPQSDDSVTQYVDWKFTSDPAMVVPAATLGSLCAQIFLDAVGRNWPSRS
jgi:predicted NUDIX family NTP pyrophosphohydrolase